MSVDPSPPTAEQALSLEIVDALSALTPRGWQRVELRLARGAHGQIRATDVSTHVPEGPSPARPQLGLDPGSLHGAVNEALQDLCVLLGRVDDPPASAAVEKRADGSYAVTLAKGVASVEHRIELPPALAAMLIFTDGLLDAMLAVERDFEPRQRALSSEIDGHDDWEYDAATLTLQLKRGVLPWRTLRAVPIGSFAHEAENWLWAWANRSLPDVARAAASATRETARAVPGLGALSRPDLPCTEAFAVRLAAVAAMGMHARGIYGAPFGPGVMLLAVMDDA
ncbi:MAG: DUF6882 domain-containing protein [Deltaproteobacteria bacterium]